jgi:hypothetical protein
LPRQENDDESSISSSEESVEEETHPLKKDTFWPSPALKKRKSSAMRVLCSVDFQSSFFDRFSGDLGCPGNYDPQEEDYLEEPNPSTVVLTGCFLHDGNNGNPQT